MVLMAGVDFPMRAVREQVSRALDLLVQVERMPGGGRKVTSITEVQRMEGETVTLQDIFEYRIDKENVNHVGNLVYTGLRPTCGKFERNGVPLPPFMEHHSFSNEREAINTFGTTPTPASAFGARPARADRRFGR
jgi:pilus assembly protein CpaF